ncbi:MAG: SpoIIE family protein phosphatase [Coriobacteriia bacterium]|nr:SpoIIE family protein phosphatase [Coriobacteriia bacterium]
MAAERKTTSVFKWRGVFGDIGSTYRWAAFVTLVLMCITFAFTQLGFAQVPVPGGQPVYAVLMLLPVSLAALLFGVGWGTLIGFIAGITMYAHAKFMALTVYEMQFVNFSTSIALLTFTGFFLGILFALALRNDPPVSRRVIRIALICFVASWLYYIAFVLNVIFTVTVNAVMAVGFEASTEEAAALANNDMATVLPRLGDGGLQAWLDFFIMAASCIATDLLTRLAKRYHGRMGMRAAFNANLTIVVFNAFLILAAVNYAVITDSTRDEAFAQMRSNANYLASQVNYNDERIESLEKFHKKIGVDAEAASLEDYQYYADAISAAGFMDSFPRETDGIVLETSAQVVLMSNVEGMGFFGEKALDPVLAQVIDESAKADEVLTYIYDGTIEDNSADISDDSFEMQYRNSEIAFVYAAYTNAGMTVANVMPSSMVYADRAEVMGSTTLSIVALLLVVFGIMSFLLDRIVLRRIDETNSVLARITGGDLNARVEVRDTLEFQSLSSGINQTVSTMQKWIAEAETRIDAELATAKAIQESALPRVFPPYPDILRFDIYASMRPAREVGGDFYDFFLIGDDSGPDSGKLGFVVADVSGKGVPAALFMMKAKTQIRDYLASGMEVGEAVENANRQLCDGNDAGMFVTAWVGVLDYATMHVDYVNAGHNPPLMWAFGFDGGDGDGAQGVTSGSWRWLKERSGLPLGLFDGLPYTAYEIDCNPGDQFLLYSDGVTEAMDVNGGLYGEDRLEALVNEGLALHPRMLVEAVRNDVARHAEGAEQSDDITILSLEVGVPPELTATLTVPADVAELPRVNEFIHTELDRRLCPLRAQNLLDVAVEELFVNVCHYAYPESADGEPGVVRVSYTYTAEPPSITVDIADDGIPYDPLAKPDAVTPDDIMDVPIGGLGILMAKRSVEDMRYERVGNSNVVSIVKRW